MLLKCVHPLQSREEFLVLFLRDKPSIYDFENELKKYNLIQAELATEVDEFRWMRNRSLNKYNILSSIQVWADDGEQCELQGVSLNGGQPVDSGHWSCHAFKVQVVKMSKH